MFNQIFHFQWIQQQQKKLEQTGNVIFNSQVKKKYPLIAIEYTVLHFYVTLCCCNVCNFSNVKEQYEKNKKRWEYYCKDQEAFKLHVKLF